MTDTPRRRAEDSEPNAAVSDAEVSNLTESPARPRRSRKSTREFFRKMKQPLIGLGMVGAAVPMINATDSGDPAAGSGKTIAAAIPTDQDADATPAGADLEESIATKIGEARAVSARETAVTEAVERYNIESNLAEEIYDAASEAGIDPKVAYGLVKTESSFNQRAVSHVGARGLTQVMPRTAKWLRPGTKAEDLYDRKVNLSLGFHYLNQLIDKYDGDVELALTAYNRGPGTVDKVLRRGGNPDNGYAGKVLKG